MATSAGLNRNAQPLTAAEWQQGAACMQIQLSDRWLLTLNANRRGGGYGFTRGGMARRSSIRRRG